jgi:hypothetical protein
METVQERKQYWGDNFIALEQKALQHLIDIVENIDTIREPHSHEDMIKLKMIKKRKEDTDKLWDYLITYYTK